MAGMSLWLLSAGVFSAVAADPGRQMLHGHVPAAVMHLKPVGQLPASQRLNLAIGLPLRNEAALDIFLKQLYDPASPNYHHYLTPEQFTEQFGPTEQDYQKVIAFAQANGLTVTGTNANRVLLDVSGSAADIEKAFQLTLHVYQHPREKRTFFSPDTEPSVDLGVPVADVSGLNNYELPHPKYVKFNSSNPVANVTAKSGSGPGGTYLGHDFRAAYAPGTALNGSGQTIGLVQFDGFDSNDIVAYENLAGLPNVPLQTNLLDSYDGTPGGGSVEVSLDIEMSISMAPGLSKIVLFEAGPSGIPNDILSAMTANSQIKQLSCSWGWSGGPSTTTDNYFKIMAAQGQSFFDASGDSDAFTPGQVDNPGFDGSPASSPYVTEVGGTTLTVNGTGGSYVSETVWNWGLDNGNYVGSSGGISSFYSIPSWQQGVSSFANNGGSTVNRNIPDVALTADNVYVAFGSGTSETVGGTSCAAPLWAGFMALVNQQAAAAGKPAVGFINPAVYEIANESIYNSTFNDITAGNNAWPSSPNAFFAVPGYDLCTGVGTPAGINLINALVNPDPLVVVSNSGFNAIGSPAGTFSPASQIFYLTNVSNASLQWSLVNTSSWLNVSTGGGTLDAGASDSVMVGFNNAATNLAPGTYTTSLGFSNVTSGVTHYRFFTLVMADALVILPTNNFNFFGPVGGPFIPTAQIITLTNAGSGALNWGINNSSPLFNVSPASGNLPAGAQTTVSFTLAPAVTNLPDGIYSATLQLTNRASQFVQTITIGVQIGQPLVQNGGFETGDFTGWSLNGDAGNYDYVDNGSTVTSIAPHSGTYFAALGEVGVQAFLSQALPTLAGQRYLLSLWLNNPLKGSRTNPNEFSVSWNGGTLYDKKNVGLTGWTNMQFLVTATSGSTVLQIGGQDNNYYLGLDDVTTTPVFAPTISTQPTNLTILSGNNAVFGASVGGSAPFAFQWRKNGINLANGGNLSGATSNILTFTAATTNNNGNYSIVVTNAYGAVTSSVAALTVVLPPAITSPLTNRTVECGSNNVTFTISPSGTAPLNFQWSLDGVPIPGATNTSLSLTNVHLPSHTISITVTNLYASVTSNAVLTVQDTLAPVIVLNGGNPIYVELGGAFSDPGATASDTCAGVLPVVITGTVNANVVGTNILAYKADDGDGNPSTVTRAVIVRDTTPPAISWSFTNLVLAADTNCGALMPDVTGTNFIVAADLSGALTVSQTPTNNFVLPVGTNTIVITVKDSSGNAAFSTNTIFVQDETPPVIFNQPSNQTNPVGSAASFSVGATACTALSFQWFFNDGTLATETNSTLTLSNINSGSAGNYFVVATANGGSSTSAVATLMVMLNSSITPASSENPAGYRDSLNFIAAVTPTAATGSVQFFTNGTVFDSEPLVGGNATSIFTASLPRGTNQITTVYSGDTIYFPATNTLSQIVTNHPPTATTYFSKRFAGLTLTIPVTNLSSNWSDMDGDTVSLAAIGISTNGVAVTNCAGTLVYYNLNNVDDDFICSISDGWGGTNFQHVHLTLLALPINAVPAITGLNNHTNNTISLNLAGASGFTYVLEAETNLVSAGGWLPVATNTLGTNNVWQFNGATTNSPQQFYRLELVH